jgi:Glyoxalase-like domain
MASSTLGPTRRAAEPCQTASSTSLGSNRVSRTEGSRAPTATEAEVQRLEALGATRYDHQQERGFDFWVLRDPWGNEFCVLHPNFPELLARRRPWTS